MLLVVVVVLSGVPVPAAEPDGEWSRPCATWPPGCEPVDAAGRRTLVAVRLVRITGEGMVPLPGGTVSFFTEESLGARFLGAATTDEFGFANLPRPENSEEGAHWLFEAPGAGFSHDFAVFDRLDGGDVDLPGGTDWRLRVLDPLGAPLAGARVEVFLGCPHAPAARVGLTGPDGVVDLANMPEWGFDFWIVAPGVRPGPYSPEELRVGRGFREILTEPGRTATGVVLDERGAPLPGVVVLQIGYPRGPLTRTDAEGRFTLPGIDGADPVGFFLPGTPIEDRAALVLTDFTSDVPLRIVLPAGGPGALAAGEVRHPVDLRTLRRLPTRLEDGSEGYTWSGESGVSVRLTRLADGFTVSGVTDRGAPGSLDSGTLRMEVPAGEYRIVAGGGFGRFAAVTLTATLPPPDGAPVEIRLGEEHPFFQITGVPEDARAVALHLPGRALSLPERAESVRLPADSPAAVLVRSDRWDASMLLPVPLARDGRRVVAFSGFPVNRLRFRVPEAETEYLGPAVTRLADGSFEVSTTLAGSRWLEVGGWLLEVDLPVDVPGVVDLGTITGTERTVRILGPDGEPVTAGQVFVSRTAGEWGEMDTDEGGVVRVSVCGAPIFLRLLVDGGLPHNAIVTADSPSEIRLPAGRIAGQVRDPGGEPLPAVVYVDGYRFDVEGGRFEVGGAGAGPHVVIVGAAGRLGEARRILLADGESRSLTFTLPPR
jgi:hypothetical protein